MNRLVLSLFPGVGLLDRAFEETGFCVVRGPDLIWGGDIRCFHPPAGVFGGVIGGPPCQSFTAIRHLEKESGVNATAKAHNRPPVSGNMIPEFERCIAESEPAWFLMENVRAAPSPEVVGYQVTDTIYNNRWAGAEQDRIRRFWLGVKEDAECPDCHEFAIEDDTWCSYCGRIVQPIRSAPRVLLPETVAILNPVKVPTVTTYEFGGKRNPHHGRTVAEMARLQGLPEGFDLPGLTVEAKRRAIANGVPLPMGRAIAKAVVEALA